LQEVRAELERVRADAAAEVAAARGQVSGEIEAADRAAEAEVARARAEARDGVARSEAEVERVRADAAAEVAAVRAQADGEIAAAREAAQAEVARARAEADDARLAAAAQVASPQLLTIPIPPLGVRAHTGRIEDALSAVRQVDYVLEAGGADNVESAGSVDVELMRSLVRTVQEQASDLSQELRDLPSRYSAEWQVDAAAGYAKVAADAYGAFLLRIAAATEQLARPDEDTDSEVIELVTTMLAEHPWRRR
jgi:colicin import membrane protein